MPTSRKILVLAAVALACQFVALAVHSTIASNIIEFVLTVFLAAACFEAAARAAGYARRFWRLIAVAFAIYASGWATTARNLEFPGGSGGSTSFRLESYLSRPTSFFFTCRCYCLIPGNPSMSSTGT